MAPSTAKILQFPLRTDASEPAVSASFESLSFQNPQNTELRKIIHVDMDAFYAAVEVLDQPQLKGLPLIIGGSPHSRSVVCTASYEARKFGVKSAMACSHAYRLCPQGIFLPPRFERYQEISSKIKKIFRRYTSLIEPLSLDEAYLDVTNNSFGLFASQIAKAIKRDIYQEIGLTCSAGVAPNKLVAKIASDMQKPNGLVVVTPDQVPAFMAPLPVRKIHGIGPATEKRLHAVGINLCRDIDNFSKEELDRKLGRTGRWLWHAAKGEDSRAVEVSYERKSFGREDTFDKDYLCKNIIEQKLEDLAKSVCASLKKSKVVGRTITLKVKYGNFESITRSKTLSSYSNESQLIFDCAKLLMTQKSEVGVRPVRLIGVSVSNLQDLESQERP